MIVLEQLREGSISERTWKTGSECFSSSVSEEGKLDKQVSHAESNYDHYHCSFLTLDYRSISSNT